jgi:hypothetical protein
MWNARANVIPVIIGESGTISKSLRKYLRNTSGKHRIKELQQIATFVYTEHAVRSTNEKYRTFNMKNNIICTTE